MAEEYTGRLMHRLPTPGDSEHKRVNVCSARDYVSGLCGDIVSANAYVSGLFGQSSKDSSSRF